MPTEQNKDIARRFLQAWNAGGLDVIDELAAPGFTVFYTHFPAPLPDAESFKQALRQTYASFPDIHITAEEIIAEGERVVVRWTYRGTHRQGELFGIPPAGREVQVSGITIYRIANGQVLEERGVVDNLSLMQQLGGE